MWVTLDQIECLQAVIEEGSLNLAAEKLNKAKSAISYSLNKLEEQLNFSLFERDAYRLNPTRRAIELNQKAKILLSAADDFKSFAEQLASGVETELKISCTDLFPLRDFNKILHKLVNNFPNTEIKFQREILSGESLLRDDIVDIGIFECIKPDVIFETKKLLDQDLILCLSKKHPFLKQTKKEQNIQNLVKNYPQIIQRSTLASSDRKGVFSEAVKWYVTDTLSKKQMILDGLGWGRLPFHFIEEELIKEKLVALKHLKQDDRVSIYIARKKNKEHGKVNDFIWNLF